MKLAEIFREFGEERHAKLIANAIVTGRRTRRIRTTKDLSDIIVRAAGRFRGRIHASTRCFQALRIAVNRELESLESGMQRALAVLKDGGRLCVISFHSLEDRIVKVSFRKLKQEGQLEILTPKPLRPTQAEARSNPKSRSARLRAARRTGGCV